MEKTAPIDLIPKNAVNHTDLPEKWVVFADSAFSTSLVENLCNKGLDCFTVSQGATYEQKGNCFNIRIAERADYQKVFAAMAKEECRLRIVHTWNFSDKIEEKLCLQNAEQYLEKGFYSLIYMQQGLIRNNLVGSVRISCLVNDGFNVTGNVEIKPEKSLSVGPMRVLFKEHPGITTLLINIETPLNASLNEKLAEIIRKETAIETEETIITYSGLTRWTETFEAVNLFRNENTVPAKLKNQGVYLITGGAGGIGRTLSMLIAEKVKATIVWTGRGILPTREKWDDLLANENTEPNLKEKIRTIQHIESMGSVMKYFSVEVSDFEGMKKVVDETESAFGPISGVIHSAGTAGGGVVAFKEKADADRVIIPKVQGTLIIKELFKDRNPDFIYLFSSITALLGEAGRVDYISGNAFMDAVCNSGFMNVPGDVVAVNWGQWGMIGMAADWQREKALRKVAGPSVPPLKASLVSNPINVSFKNSDGNKESFNVDLNAEKHWVFNEHILSGMPTLLGASYLDVLVKWKELKGFKENITIKNGQFVSPLMIVNKASRELQLICEDIGEKQFSFTFSSTQAGASGDAWKVHFQGEIELVADSETAKSDISVIQNTIAAEPDRTPHFLYVLGAANKVLLQYSNRWNCKESIHVGENEWLTKLQLPEEFVQDLSVFYIHPAMLDVATSAHFMHLTSNYGSFLPYSYGKVVVYRPFEAEMYCHSKLSVPYKKGDEYIHFDFELFNKDGYPVMSMKEYAFVKISDAAEPVSGDVTESRTIKIETDENDIMPDEGKIILETLLQHDGLGQVIVYTKDLNLDFKESKVTYVRRDLEKKIKKTEVLANTDDRPDIDTPYEAPDNEIEKSIAAIWTGILGINKIGATDSFNELGGNSLLAIQVISGIGEEFSIEIQANEFVNNSTIRALSDLVLVKILDEHDGAEIEELLKEETVI